MDNKKYWIAIINADNQYYVLSAEDGSVNGRDSKKDMLDLFTKEYAKSSKRGYGVQTSAVIHQLIYTPSVVQMSVEDITSKLLDIKKGVQLHKLGSSTGSLYGLKCNGPANIEEIFKSGTIPKLTFE